MNHEHFQVLSPELLPLLLDFQRRFPSLSCERNPGNLFLYNRCYDWRFRVEDSRLFAVSAATGHRLYPAGAPPDRATVAAWLTAAGAAGLFDVPEAAQADLPEGAVCLYDESEFDYLYELEHLIALSGSRLRKKHNLIRQFQREYPAYTVTALTAAELDDTVALACELNAAHRDSAGLAEDYAAIAALKTCWPIPELNLDGILLRVGAVIVGFAVFSPLGGGGADIHLEKARHEFAGAGATLTWELAKVLRAKGFTVMNREQDLGEPGLRQAKRALDPCAMLRRGVLRFAPGSRP